MRLKWDFIISLAVVGVSVGLATESIAWGVAALFATYTLAPESRG